tara:strand:+ start:94 stop:567 length:474 start_codon:yes stop_codon:yes gene_type:complete
MKNIFGDFDVMVKQCLAFFVITLVALLYFGCSSQISTSENVINDWVDGEVIYYQAYDANWDDPTISPIFLTKAEAQEYVDRNNIGSQLAQDTSHKYIVRVINYRYEIRQVNDWRDEVLHTTNSKEDGVKYVEQFRSAHEDLFMYDLKTGKLVINSTP